VEPNNTSNILACTCVLKLGSLHAENNNYCSKYLGFMVGFVEAEEILSVGLNVDCEIGPPHHGDKLVG
jgi:hypothetical protein